ncbi:MAG TPA: hypothetical protein VNJ08_05095 [Bacteriovoracaceae bacterium]|nr:hypothetical protein [Bacteriovoracaceae bacterium]
MKITFLIALAFFSLVAFADQSIIASQHRVIEGAQKRLAVRKAFMECDKSAKNEKQRKVCKTKSEADDARIVKEYSADVEKLQKAEKNK